MRITLLYSEREVDSEDVICHHLEVFNLGVNMVLIKKPPFQEGLIVIMAAIHGSIAAAIIFFASIFGSWAFKELLFAHGPWVTALSWELHILHTLWKERESAE